MTNPLLYSDMTNKELLKEMNTRRFNRKGEIETILVFAAKRMQKLMNSRHILVHIDKNFSYGIGPFEGYQMARDYKNEFEIKSFELEVVYLNEI